MIELAHGQEIGQYVVTDKEIKTLAMSWES
jgi:hypothetical protein